MAIDFAAKNSTVISMDDQITLYVIVGSIIATLVLGFALTFPINGKIKKHNKRLKVIRSVNLNAVQSMVSQEKMLTENTKKIEADLSELEAMLSQKKDVSNLIDSFVDTAEEKNLIFDSLQPLPGKVISLEDEDKEVKAKSRKAKTTGLVNKKTEETKAMFLETVMRVELTSSFSDFLTFLWETERLDKTLRVKYLSIVGAEEGSTHKYRMIISVLKFLNNENNKN